MLLKSLLALAPVILLQVGTLLKNKDVDNIGRDDAAGNIFIALAPALSASAGNNENAFVKALIVARKTIDNYLEGEANVE